MPYDFCDIVLRVEGLVLETQNQYQGCQDIENGCSTVDGLHSFTYESESMRLE